MAGSLLQRQLWTKPAAIRRMRRLDADGRVLVTEGEVVQPEDVILRGERVPAPLLVPAARILKLSDPSLDRYLTKRQGEAVRQGEVIAKTSGLLGLGTRACQSPAAGTLELGPSGSGEVLIALPAQDVEVRAHYPGVVVSVLAPRAVVVEFAAVGVQGIVGAGGESGGTLRVLSGPYAAISANRISNAFVGSVLVGGSADLAALRRAAVAGVAGMVVGSVSGAAFEAFVAERHPMPLVVTDGFGAGGMARRCFDVLQQHESREARVRGAEGGDGAEPPEVFVPIDDPAAPRTRPPVLELGALVRIVAGAEAFAVAQVSAVGAAPAQLPSGLVSRWIEVQLDDGRQVRVPVENVELLG